MKKIMFNDRYGLTEAVLQGTKTITRRERKKGGKSIFFKPPYKVGEIVAVAQSYYAIMESSVKVPYKFDVSMTSHKGWTNKMFVCADLMPHQIRIVSVRADRLQDITDEDCLREGLVKYTKDKTVYKYDLDDGFEMFTWRDMKRTPQEAFATLIDKISGKETWERNPYVWRIEFELIK